MTLTHPLLFMLTLITCSSWCLVNLHGEKPAISCLGIENILWEDLY